MVSHYRQWMSWIHSGVISFVEDMWLACNKGNSVNLHWVLPPSTLRRCGGGDGSAAHHRITLTFTWSRLGDPRMKLFGLMSMPSYACRRGLASRLWRPLLRRSLLWVVKVHFAQEQRHFRGVRL